MNDLLQTFLTSAAGGGATGLVGIFIQRWMDHKKALLELRILELQLTSAERTRQIEIEANERMAGRMAEIQAAQMLLDAQARESESAERAYVASVQADQATYLAPQAQEKSKFATWLMACVDAVRGIMRPGISAYTLWMLTVVFWWVRELYLKAGPAMTAAQVQVLADQAVGTIVYLAVTTTVWWFGVRPSQPKGR